MYIKQLELENFKGFKKATIPFCKSLTVINGPNGAGKSNILDGINFVCGKIENDLNLFSTDSLKLSVKIIFDNDNTITKILEKDLSGNIKTLCYLNDKIVSEDEILRFLKDLSLTIVDNCGSTLSKSELAKYAQDLKAKSMHEQVIVVSLREEIISVADKILGVINNDKLVGISLNDTN